jgi:predicted transcriptional regulator
MQMRLTPELEARLVEFAARDGRTPDQLVEEALERFFAADVDFVEAVMKGLASLDRGEFVSHEAVGKRIDRLFQPDGG